MKVPEATRLGCGSSTNKSAKCSGFLSNIPHYTMNIYTIDNKLVVGYIY